MYGKTARYYDAIYAAMGKDYGRESDRLHRVIQHHKRSPGSALLDVACGTGGHIGHLQRHYAVEGLDLDPDMLSAARRKHPDIMFHQADMTDFDLARTFDVIVCLFSAIAYTHTVPRLRRMLRVVVRHLRPGGVFAAEPFIAPGQWRDGAMHADFVDQPDLKLARMNISRRDGRLAVLDFHFLVTTPSGIEYFTERHDLALFSHEEYLDAFRLAGLDVHHDPVGLMGRGLYIGLRPDESREGV